MGNSFKSVFMLLALGTLPVHSFAQKDVIIEDDVPNSIMFVSRDKAGEPIISILQKSQLPRFQDPRAPRFILTDRKGRFALGIGGYVKTTAEYDFGGIVNDVDFYPALIPNQGSGDYARNQFQMDITTSNLFLQLVGRTKRLGDFVVHVGGNFRGSGNTFQLRNAYASFLGFTIGYTWGSFMDAAAEPATIDFAGPGGMTIYHATQIRYQCSFLKHWKAVVGVEIPDVNGTTTSDFTITTQRMPNFTAYGQYDWNAQSHIRVGGIIRRMTYNSLLDKKAYSQTGWGVQSSITFNFLRNFQAFGQFAYGEGIASFMNDLSNLNLDLVPDPAKKGHMQVLPMMGWYGGLQYNFSPKVFMTVAYSESRLYADNGYPAKSSEDFERGRYLVTNIFWNATPNLQAGAEYLRGKRIDFNNQGRHANRINLSMQYSF